MSEYTEKNQGGGATSSMAYPSSWDAERSVIGACMIRPDIIGEVAETLSPDHFYVEAHKWVFYIIISLHKSGVGVDLTTLTQTLKDQALLDQAGGPGAIVEMINYTPTASNWPHYAQIVREKSLLRQMVILCDSMARRALAQDEPVELLLDEAQSAMLQIGEETKTADATMRPLRDGLSEAIDVIEKTYEHRGKILGIPTGFTDFDRMTGGLDGPQLIVIAARPSMGKTAFALNAAVNMATAGYKVGVFSLEMSFKDLATRALCTASEVNLGRVRDGFLSRNQVSNMVVASNKLNSLGLYIDDTGAISIQEFRRRARRAKKNLGVQVIMIDYIQLMRSTSKRAQDNRQLEIAEISAGLKQTAKDLNIPIIALAQLNRNVEARPGSRPQMSDMRESGSIEQDADLVGMLYREEYYVKSDEKREKAAEKAGLSLEDWERSACLIVGKQRNGPVGDVPMVFKKEFAQFLSATERLYSNNEDQRQH
tara:strand:- start:6404 stop:7849 length:1446 start_codon:yes stop_codon:yes gene_type:complete